MRDRASKYEKEKKRENIIDEAISPPFSQVQCILFAPETQLKGEDQEKKKRGKKSQKPEKEDV